MNGVTTNLTDTFKIIIKNKYIHFTTIKNNQIIWNKRYLGLSPKKFLEQELKKIEFSEIYHHKSNIYKNKDNPLENYKMPPIVICYYYFYSYYCKIPSLEELVNFYIKSFCEILPDNNIQFLKKYITDTNNKNIIFDKNTLFGRISRAYNSYHRELHLLFSLQERFEDIDISYNLEYDLKGIDLIVHTEEKDIGLATYIQTKRSEEFHKKKFNYRHDFDIEVKELPLNNQNNFYIGDIMLYDINKIDIKLFPNLTENTTLQQIQATGNVC